MESKIIQELFEKSLKSLILWVHVCEPPVCGPVVVRVAPRYHPSLLIFVRIPSPATLPNIEKAIADTRLRLLFERE